GELLAEVLEALVELLDATGRVHDALLARVERVRRCRDFDVDHGVLGTVELDRLAALGSRTRQVGLARAEVAEDDVAVVGVNVSLHEDPSKSCVLRRESCTSTGAPRAPNGDSISRRWVLLRAQPSDRCA